VAFGSFVDDDPIAAMLEAVAPWRGTLLRHYSVGSWRRIWSWLVDRVAGLTLADDVASDFADALPSGTVGEFTLGLPAILVNGIPAPAEENARGDDQRSVPDRELAVIAMGAMRLDTLAGPARDAFAGRPIELSPAWVGRRLDDWRGRSLRDFGVELVNDLLTRARRVAMSKMQRRPDGTLWLPTRLYERGDYLWRTSREGAGDVGLRIDQLGTVLAEAGVFRHGADGWAVTAAGEAVLD